MASEIRYIEPRSTQSIEANQGVDYSHGALTLLHLFVQSIWNGTVSWLGREDLLYADAFIARTRQRLSSPTLLPSERVSIIHALLQVKPDSTIGQEDLERSVVDIMANCPEKLKKALAYRIFVEMGRVGTFDPVSGVDYLLAHPHSDIAIRAAEILKREAEYRGDSLPEKGHLFGFWSRDPHGDVICLEGIYDVVLEIESIQPPVKSE